MWDERLVAIQLLFCGVLFPGFVPDREQHFLWCSHLAFYRCVLFIVDEVHPYSSTPTAAACKKSRFVLSDRSDFRMIDSLLIASPAFTKCMLTSFSVDEMLLPKYRNWFTNFRGLHLRVEVAPFGLEHMYSVLFAFTYRPTRRSLLESCTWMSLCWPISKVLHTSALELNQIGILDK